MKAYYEQTRDEYNKLDLQHSRDFSFPLHFHRDLEVFVLCDGEYRLTINGQEYVVGGGTVTVFDSFDVHSYALLSPTSTAYVMIIPHHYLTRLQAKRGRFCVANPIIQDESFCGEIADLAARYFKTAHDSSVQETAAELLVALLCERLEFTQKAKKDEVGLVRQVLVYVHEHFRDKLTLHSTAKALGYTEEHLSRVFHKFVRSSFSAYVNGLRLEYVKAQKKKGDARKLTEIIFEAGFQSQQTYYRVRGGEAVGKAK